MKTIRMCSFLVLILILGTTGAFAQSDPIGIQDTVRLVNLTVSRGSVAIIDVHIYNDEELYGVSVPLHFNNQYLTCDSVSFVDTKLGNIELHQFHISNDSGYVILGGLVLNGETPLATGSGTLARLGFTVNPNATVGVETIIDSGFVEPAGEFVLTGPEAAEILPVFISGVVTITNTNQPPVFEPIPDQYVIEGENLQFDVSAYDRERDDFDLFATRLPEGAEFTSDNNLFSWTPDFIGANSSVGNPYEVIFVASDGNSSAHLKVRIEVINKNRVPVISVENDTQADAGDLVQILVAADDPDLENVEISVANLPDGAEFNNQNPGLISWNSMLADSGNYQIEVSAVDPSGSVTTEQLNLKLNSVAACELALSSVQTYIGEEGVVEVSLANHVEVNSMKLLITYDPTALEYVSTSKTGSRMENWEQYNVIADEFTGKIWITAAADLPGGGTTPPLETGEGVVAALTFQASSNLNYVGYLLPINFAFLDTEPDGDNTFTDADDEVITQDQVSYTNGSYFIKQYEGLIGDINLNGVAFEIADVIYFTNYFINQTAYPLAGEALQNSDVNQDGRYATIADLVYLVRIVTGDLEQGGSEKIGLTPDKLATSVIDYRKGGFISLQTEWQDELGAALFRISGFETEPEIYPTARTANTNIYTNFENQTLSILICDPEGRSIAAGTDALIEIFAAAPENCSLESADLSDVYGNQITAVLKSRKSIPENFELGQNYPNPFNPSTTISFGLPVESQVELTVYNIRGQKVKSLVNSMMSAGYHEVVWDGTDQRDKKVSSGVYFYKLKSEDITETPFHQQNPKRLGVSQPCPDSHPLIQKAVKCTSTLTFEQPKGRHRTSPSL